MKRIKKCLKHIFQIPYLEHHVKWKNNEFGRKPMYVRYTDVPFRLFNKYRPR